jgi:hypothetical protein
MFRLTRVQLVAVVILCGRQESIDLWSQAHVVGVQHSAITVHVFRSGLFSAFAGNHEIRAPISSASWARQDGGWNWLSTHGIRAVDKTEDGVSRLTVDDAIHAREYASVHHYVWRYFCREPRYYTGTLSTRET